MDSGKVIDRVEECALLLTALANRNRLEIMCHLIEGEMAVGAIAEKIGLSQSALSQHLAKLRAVDLVNTRRDRQKIYYSCGSDEARALIRTLCAVFAEGGTAPEMTVNSHPRSS